METTTDIYSPYFEGFLLICSVANVFRSFLLVNHVVRFAARLFLPLSLCLSPQKLPLIIQRSSHILCCLARSSRINEGS